MASPVLQIRRGPAANIGLVTLRAGEPGFTTDKYELYVGTGSTITLGINTITNQLITAPVNKFLGSANYWSRETSSTGGGVNLLESTSSGENYITLASPASLVGNVQYTFPASPVEGGLLKSNNSGVLSWVTNVGNITADSITVGFLTVTNPAYFSDTTDSTSKDSGAIIVEGGVGIEKSVNIGGNLSVSGISTFVGEVTFQGGTINLGDSPNDDIILGGEFASSIGPSTTGVYDFGSTNKRWRGIYAVDSNISGSSTVTGALTVGNGANITGKTSVTDLSVTGIATISNGLVAEQPALGGYSIQSNGSVRISQELQVSGITTVGGFLDANNGLDVQNHTELDSLNVTGIATFTNYFNVSAAATFTGSVTGTISTATRAITVDTTTSSGNQGYFFTFVDDPTGQTGETVRVSYGASFNPGTRTINVENLNATNIKAKDGTSAITLTNASGAVGVTSDLTVSGNLYVLGLSAEVNTETLKVEDSLIEVGLVNSGGLLGAPTGDLDIDVGILMHWYSGGAKKAAAFWDDSSTRIVLASDVSETSSVITVNTYAALEINSLWINDCAGQSQIISCVNTERLLNNITVDGGSF